MLGVRGGSRWGIRQDQVIVVVLLVTGGDAHQLHLFIDYSGRGTRDTWQRSPLDAIRVKVAVVTLIEERSWRQGRSEEPWRSEEPERSWEQVSGEQGRTEEQARAGEV